MKIAVALTEADYIKFNEYHMMHSKQGKKTITAQRLLLPILSVVILAVFLASGVEKDLDLLIIETIALAIASVVWFFAAPKLMTKNLSKSIRKMKADGKLPYPEQAQLEFSDDGIIEITENSTMKVAYSDVVSIGRTEEHIFVFFGAIQAFVIPRRCMEDSGTALEALLREKTNL